MSHLGITPVLILSLNPGNVLEPCLMPAPKLCCPHRLSLPISGSATRWDNAWVGGECVAVGLPLFQWVPGAIRCGDASRTWCHPGCHSGVTQEDPCIAFPSASQSKMQQQRVQMLFLSGALPALPGLQWPGTPHMSLVLCKAEEFGLSMPKQHLLPKSTYPEICSSAHSAKKCPQISVNGSDLRNTGDGCCREGGAGLQIQLLC